MRPRSRRWFVLFALCFGCTPDGGGSADEDEPIVVIGDAAMDGTVADVAVADLAGLLDAGADAGHDAATEPVDAAADAAPPPVPPICHAGTEYTAGTSIFVERTAEWKLAQLGVLGTRLSVGDLDGDGWADVVVRQGLRLIDIFGPTPADVARHQWVLRNDHDAFLDVTEESGLLTPRGDFPIPLGRPIDVVAFADLDNDGDLDAYTGTDTREPITIERAGEEPITVAETSEVLFNDGSGRFTLAPADYPLRRAGLVDVPSGAAFVDVDRDGHIDFWQSQGGLGAPLQDRLYVNDGQGRLVDGTAAAGLTTDEWNFLEP
ncbi:MAG: VCBS repeat-containing protein, partial [Myxococcales bacterium]|nr:VCBS repeat-containing protein [Myxococcales bacterium]